MDSVVNIVEIAGDIGPVFDLVTSARFSPRWHPATQSVGVVTERPYQSGDLIHERGQIAGIQFAVTWQVVEHERPTKTVIRSPDPSALILYRFEGGPEGPPLRVEATTGQIVASVRQQHSELGIWDLGFGFEPMG